MAHDTFSVQYRHNGGRSGVKRDDQPIAMERNGRGREVVVVEGHERVDAEREGGYRILFEHQFGRHCPYGEFLCAYMQRIKRILTCSGM